MEWPLVLLLMLGGFISLLLTGLPVAFCFILINLVGSFFMLGGLVGLHQLAFSIFRSVARFSLLPIPMFVLMGELMFRSGMGFRLMDAADRWLGRLPGRLGLVAVVGGTLFSTMSGSTMGTTAMLGDVLVPEMERRGYKKPMSIGPVLGSGGLAMIIPPSTLGVIFAAIAEISIGKTLIAGIIPGLLMAILYAGYIIGRCWLQPSVAPPYETAHIPLTMKIVFTVKYVLPLGLIVFLVLGLIFLGVATPSEAAAMGVLGSVVLAAGYRRLNWEIIRKSIASTVQITVMALMILSAAISFSQLLAISGTTKGVAGLITGLHVAPIVIVIVMQLIILFLGTFVSALGIIMICVPIFMPIIISLGLDPIWFAIITLINLEMATTSPPFGMGLYVMKGVAPPDTTMGDIIRAAIPFLLCDMVSIMFVMAFPILALWLPNMM